MNSQEWRRVDADGKVLKLRLENGYIIPHCSRPTSEQTKRLEEINFGPNGRPEQEEGWE